MLEIAIRLIRASPDIVLSEPDIDGCCDMDPSWWRHQMETFSPLLALCAVNSSVPVNSPHKSQRHGALMFSLICTWTKGWAITRDGGDLRRHRAHYDITVMSSMYCSYPRVWRERDAILQSPWCHLVSRMSMHQEQIGYLDMNLYNSFILIQLKITRNASYIQKNKAIM